MKKEDYQIINDYFNKLALNIFACKDIENKYFTFIRLNDSFCNYFSKRYLQKDSYHNETKTNHITYEEVLNISREIIETINEKYLSEFDNLLKSGDLDFSYTKEYFDSHVDTILKNNKILNRSIKINRDYNYTDIETFIHEFMHYVCFIGCGMKNKILSEFISIYFELYANQYIYDKYRPNLEEIFYNKRLVSNYYRTIDIRKIEIPLLLYNKFGNLNQYSYKDSQYFLKYYTKNDYDGECQKTLELINMVLVGNDKYLIEEHHVYLIATALAFYFRKKNDIKDIVNFVDNVNKRENYSLDLIELLKKYNLNIDSDMFETLYTSIDDYLDIFEFEKRQGR